MAPSTFPQFANLPKEIRYMIWECAANVPRQVSFNFRSVPGGIPGCMIHHSGTFHGGNWKKQCTCPSYAVVPTDKVPVVLQVCFESRKMAKMAYERAFSHSFGVRQTYFNFQQDTLYMPALPPFIGTHMAATSITYMDQKDISRVKRLELRFESMDHKQCFKSDDMFRRTISLITPYTTIFPNLEKMTLVLDHITMNHEKGDTSPMSLIDPIDVDETLRIYKHPDEWSPSRGLAWRLNRATHEPAAVPLNPMVFKDNPRSKVSFQDYMAEKYKDRPLQLDYKVAISEDYQAGLEKLLGDRREDIRGFRKELEDCRRMFHGAYLTYCREGQAEDEGRESGMLGEFDFYQRVLEPSVGVPPL